MENLLFGYLHWLLNPTQKLHRGVTVLVLFCILKDIFLKDKILFSSLVFNSGKNVKNLDNKKKKRTNVLH